ncbi:hypothetical protein BJ508DRAFT_307626 [Ascobolus immersus RN42]|uniref:Uncharacterized protein n=1 Tax=Ascobolus immersus RN42 TaxID=1160509 RepID=A0A3N4I2B9_ASCIM|nr:hypothetical protein BJ508DRAFT_307626 [Ascobolus immersus RN42]
MATTTTPSSLISSAPSSSSSVPGLPRQLPPTYQAFLDRCAKPTPFSLGIRLGASKIPEKLHDFLQLCEQEDELIAYDKVLYDTNLEEFIEVQGVSEFFVMMYKFLPDAGVPGGLDTVEDVMRHWVEYVIVFVNRDGYLCEYQFDEGGEEYPLKWEYTTDCYLRAISVLGYGLYR